MIAWLALVLSIAGGAVPSRGLASYFGGRDDAHRGGPAACWRNGERVGADAWGVAHRSLPCGRLVAIILPRNGRAVIAPVIDRGPYGTINDAGAWEVAPKHADGRRRPRAGYRYRGILDMTRPVSRALGHRGLETVIAVPLPWHAEDRHHDDG